MKNVQVILGVTRWDEKKNTDLRAKAGLKRVEVMMMKRRLRWLGHVAQKKEDRIPKCLLVCKPAGGKCSVGGQKRRWNDVLVDDLKKCELYSSWREEVQDRHIWRGWISTSAEDLNEELKAAEQRKKDELKQRREATKQEQNQNGWGCSEQGCHFVGRTKAGLVNHVRQKHCSVALDRKSCPRCRKSFHKQG